MLPPALPTHTHADTCTVHRDHTRATTVLATMWDATSTHDTQLVIREAGCEEVRLSAHRAVLAAASRPFRSMLCGGLREQSAADVELREVDGASMRSLLLFVVLPAPASPPIRRRVRCLNDEDMTPIKDRQQGWGRYF